MKASDLIALFRQAYDEKWGYIWGTRGQTWTQASQSAATREMTVKYGSRWIGRRVADCSGLFVWAYKQLGGSIYHGSNTIWNKYTSDKGAVGGKMSIAPGTAVFQVNDGVRTHIGLYIGNGKVIEAQETRTGVVMSDLSRWREWGVLKDIEYDLPEDVLNVTPRTLKKGDTGSGVVEVQEALLQAGYDVGKNKNGDPLVDGIYGGETMSAVRAFQHDNGLDPDGIVGPLTWAALHKTEDDEPDGDGDNKPTEAPEEPNEPLDRWATLSIEEKVEDLNERLKRQEGGESDG